MSVIHGITSFYTPKNTSRDVEIKEALRKNISCFNIKKLHLFLDTKDDLIYLHNTYRKELENGRIQIVSIGKQPLYSDLVTYANRLEGEICMIMNSDIWLHSISDMRLFDNFENKIYGITRHESSMEPKLLNTYARNPNFIGSQDAFIFRSPLKPEIIKKIEFPQNIWGSDNVLLRELANQGYVLLNPAMQIIIVHEHVSNFRENNRQRLPPPWLTLKPNFIKFG